MWNCCSCTPGRLSRIPTAAVKHGDMHSDEPSSGKLSCSSLRSALDTCTRGGRGYSNGGSPSRFSDHEARLGREPGPCEQPVADAFCNRMLWHRTDGNGQQPLRHCKI